MALQTRSLCFTTDYVALSETLAGHARYLTRMHAMTAMCCRQRQQRSSIVPRTQSSRLPRQLRRKLRVGASQTLACRYLPPNPRCTYMPASLPNVQLC